VTERPERRSVPTCPRCGSQRVAPILYGLPAFNERLNAALREKRIVLGGCLVGPDNPVFHCNACSTEWGRLGDAAERP
jgi:hypothetical protein